MGQCSGNEKLAGNCARKMHIIIASGNHLLMHYFSLAFSPANAVAPALAAAVDSLGGRGTPTSTLIQAVPHPFLPEACLLLYGSPAGGLAILEVVGKTEPVLLQQGRTPDGAPVIGMGLHKVWTYEYAPCIHQSSITILNRPC
jgi:hypothetical protein